MTTTEEIHAAAIANLENHQKTAIVHILNVLRRLPPALTLTRAEEAQAANTVDVTKGGKYDLGRRDYLERVARMAIGHIKVETGYLFSGSVSMMIDAMEMVEPPPGANSPPPPRVFPQLVWTPWENKDVTGQNKRMIGRIEGDATSLFFIEWMLNVTDPGLVPKGRLYGIAIPDGQEGVRENHAPVLVLQQRAQEYLNAFLRKYA